MLGQGVVLTACGGRLICVRLLEALACDYTIPSSPRLLADPHIVCWTGRHLYMAAASLVALSFFVPLSIMVAPMLMEAPHGMAVREYPPTLVTHCCLMCASAKKEKDVRYVKLFLMVVGMIKCGMLVLGAFGGRSLTTSLVASAVACVALGVVTTAWFVKGGNRVLHAEPDASRPHILPDFEPCSVPFVNAWKACNYAVGAWSAAVMLAAHGLGPHSRILPHDQLQVVLAAGWGLIAVLAVAKHLLWKKKFRSTEASTRGFTACSPVAHTSRGCAGENQACCGRSCDLARAGSSEEAVISLPV